MKRFLLMASLLMASLQIHAQTIFEKGYFITDEEERIECFIQNLDWKNNPEHFNYKKTRNASIEEASIKTVKEFGIEDKSKYRRFTLEVDMSSDMQWKLSKSPKFDQVQEKTMFLKVLVEGEASLYQYKEKGFIKYFYALKDGEIEQLFYKRYHKTTDARKRLPRDFTSNPTVARLESNTRIEKITKNNRFQQQIWNNLKYPKLRKEKLKHLKYQRKSLMKIFVDYNKSKSGDISHLQKDKKGLFKLGIKSGVDIASLLGKSRLPIDYEFGQKTQFRIGIDAEFILPYNNNKWSVFIEPTYRSYTAETELDVLGTAASLRAAYHSLEVPIGVRHYFFLNDNSKIFLSAAFLIDYTFKSSEVTYQLSNQEEGPEELYDLVEFTPSLVFGLGYKLKDKYSLGIKYGLTRDIFAGRGSGANALEYRAFSIVLGYHFF